MKAKFGLFIKYFIWRAATLRQAFFLKEGESKTWEIIPPGVFQKTASARIIFQQFFRFIGFGLNL